MEMLPLPGVDYGIFTRKRTCIPLERIQSAELSAGVVQRIFVLMPVLLILPGGS